MLASIDNANISSIDCKNTPMTEMKPKLSVIVPISGGPDRIKHLGEWFEFTNLISLEVILVEDNLQKETQEELQFQLSKFPKEYSLLRVTGEFGNPGTARNAGIEKRTGDWVAFWDSDDQPKLSKIAQILSQFSLTDVDYIYTDFLIFNESNQETTQNRFASKSENTNLSLIALEPGIWRFIFREKVIRNINFPPLRMGEDQIFLAKLNLQKWHGKYLQINAYVYSKNIGSQLTKDRLRYKYLENSVSEMLDLLNSDASKFAKLVVIRQSLTLLINGSVPSKLIAIKALLLSTVTYRSWHELIYVISKELKALAG